MKRISSQNGVNCQRKMASGVAKALKEKYPQIYDAYMSINKEDMREMLGRVQYIKINEELTIANAFTQFNYGYDGKKYASYDAIMDCFMDIESKGFNKIHFPMIACGLAGCEWSIVSSIIEKTVPNADKTLWILE